MKIFFSGVIIVLGMLVMLGCSAKKPTHIGLLNQSLQPCPDKPNCVCSQCVTTEQHQIAPLTYRGEKAIAIEQLKNLLLSLPRVKIIAQNNQYIHATFTSKIMRFVDDVELYFTDEGIIHVRSASRLGYSDFGVNRKRVEMLRQQWDAQQRS